jgi:hypothetical protein
MRGLKISFPFPIGEEGQIYRTAASIGAGRLVRAMLSHLQDNRVLVLRKPISSALTNLAMAELN